MSLKQKHRKQVLSGVSTISLLLNLFYPTFIAVAQEDAVGTPVGTGASQEKVVQVPEGTADAENVSEQDATKTQSSETQPIEKPESSTEEATSEQSTQENTENLETDASSNPESTDAVEEPTEQNDSLQQPATEIASTEQPSNNEEATNDDTSQQEKQQETTENLEEPVDFETDNVEASEQPAQDTTTEIQSSTDGYVLGEQTQATEEEVSTETTEENNTQIENNDVIAESITSKNTDTQSNKETETSGDLLDSAASTSREEEQDAVACISDDYKIHNSDDSDWKVNETKKRATTRDDVELGIEYRFPLQHDVTITFTCLPTSEKDLSKLTIKEVNVSDLDLPEGIYPATDVVYDVTTDMIDGTFKYNVTLPKPEGENVKVSYIEANSDDVISNNHNIESSDVKSVDNGSIKQTDDDNQVTVEDLDHFTIYVPIISDSPGTKPSVNIDQCQNGAVSDLPDSEQCIDNSWINGNVNEQKAHYYEGDVIPYRSVFDNLSVGETYTVTIEWDTTKSGKHAIDYLATYNETETDADPCHDIYIDCTGDPSTYPIPEDTFMTSDPDWSGTQLDGVFTMYNGTIVDVSAYDNPNNYNGDTSTSLTVTFVADADDYVVLAWGGHISTRQDWGQDNSAISISGSPYHMRLLDFTCSNQTNCGVGNQDLSLSASAVIFPGDITIIKEASPEGTQEFDFTGDLGNFTLIDNGTDANTIVFSDLTEFTTYDITETLPAGWTLDNISCIDPNDNSVTTGATASISLEEGESVVCTFENSAQQATLTLVKTVINDNGGELEVADFNLYIDGVLTTSGVAAVVPTGQVLTATEDTVAGYEPSNWGGDCATDGTITLQPGDNKICTITNDDISPTVTLYKEVINTNGGTALPEDFTLLLGGQELSSGDTVEVDSNTTITVDEELLPGYTFVEITGDAACPAVLGGSMTLGEGEDVTCTIVNQDVPAKLTLIKTVMNDYGGTLEVSDFNLYVDGSPVTSGVAVSLPGNQTYQASEDEVAGYVAGDWGGDCASDGTVTLAIGDNKTCTITNSDVQPLLTVTKVVVNDNGGEAVVSDFPLNVSGTTVVSGVQNGFDAGNYVVGETNLTGYEATISGDCDADGNVSLSVGDAKECIITNNDIAPQLTLIKTVINNNGGELEVADFELFVDNIPVISGVSTQLQSNVEYQANETPVDGYEPSNWGGDCASDGTITLQPGDNKICTITNDDIAPKLTVIKIVNGGTAEVSNFALYVDNTQVTSGDQNSFNVGTYTVSEDNLNGYTAAISGDCSETGTVTLELTDAKTCTITNTRDTGALTVNKELDLDGDGQFETIDNAVANSLGFNWFFTDNAQTTNDMGSTVSDLETGPYAVNETVVDGYHYAGYVLGDRACSDLADITEQPEQISVDIEKDTTTVVTLCNAVDTGTLRVTKVVDPADSSLWDISIEGPTPNTDVLEHNDTTETLTSVIGDYTISESGNNVSETDYTSAYECFVGDNNTADVAGVGTQLDITLENEQSVHCIFTNSIKRGSIAGTKYHDRDATGTITKQDETLQGWSITLLDADLVVLDTTVTATDGTYSFANLLPGEYTVCESLQNGWTQIAPTTNEGCYDVTVTPDQDVIGLDFFNFKNITISGYKFSDLNGNGVWDEDEPQLSGWKINNENQTTQKTVTTGSSQGWTDGYYEFTNLGPGTYNLSETLTAGWLQTFGDDPYIVEALGGQDVTDINFGNVQDEPELQITKENDWDGVDLLADSGDKIKYTLTVTAVNGNVNDVLLTDTLPEGFEYVSGTWTAVSDIRGDLVALGITSEPNYQTATWKLGDMIDGETVTLTYKAKVLKSADPGLYKDLAWAEGEKTSGGEILALAQPLGYIDTYFVGTVVGVTDVRDPDSAEATVTREVVTGEVLGAATSYLPATGSDTIWVKLSGIGMVVGTSIVLLGLLLNRKEKYVD